MFRHQLINALKNRRRHFGGELLTDDCLNQGIQRLGIVLRLKSKLSHLFVQLAKLFVLQQKLHTGSPLRGTRHQLRFFNAHTFAMQ